MPRLIRPAPIPSRLVRAAGAVVWRFTDPERTPIPGESIDPHDIEVLMVHRPRYRDWSWPKGKAERSESIVNAAVREVEEETGLVVVLGAPLTTQRYRLGSGQTKEVYYWIGTLVSSDPRSSGGAVERTRLPVHTAPTAEIDLTRWAKPSRAEQMLTRRGDRRLLSEVVTRARDGLLVTTTLAVVRHAKAMSRSSWFGGEARRPLTRLGVRQSLDLIDILSAFGIESAVSSPWTRCRQTLAPWAGLSDAPILYEDDLTEDATKANPEAASRVMSGLVAQASGPTAICVHRPTIPLLLKPLRDAAPSTLTRLFPSSSPWLGTTDLLIAHVAHTSASPSVIGIERHGTRTKEVFGVPS